MALETNDAHMLKLHNAIAAGSAWDAEDALVAGADPDIPLDAKNGYAVATAVRALGAVLQFMFTHLNQEGAANASLMVETLLRAGASVDAPARSSGKASFAECIINRLSMPGEIYRAPLYAPAFEVAVTHGAHLGAAALCVWSRAGVPAVLNAIADAKQCMEAVNDATTLPFGIFTPLLAAIDSGCHEAVSVLLLRFRADPSGSVGSGTLDTPLVRAVHGECVEMVQCLVDAGAPANAARQDSCRATPLLIAASKGSCEAAVAIVEVLLAGGADPNVSDAYGMTPLHAAVLAQNDQLCECLLHAGADMSAVTAAGVPVVYMLGCEEPWPTAVLLHLAWLRRRQLVAFYALSNGWIPMVDHELLSPIAESGEWEVEDGFPLGGGVGGDESEGDPMPTEGSPVHTPLLSA